MHVHVISGDGEAKYRLEPEIELAKNYRYSRKQLRYIESLIEVHYHELISAWKKHFSSLGHKHIGTWRVAVDQE